MARTSLLSLLLFPLLLAGCSAQEDIRSPPSVLKPDRPDTRYISGGSDFQLECEAEGKPQPTYKWWRDEQPVEITDKVSVDAQTGLLSITNYNSYEHDGEYMCIASNEFKNPSGPPNTASSFSPIIKLLEARMNINSGEDKKLTGTEYSYFMIPCSYEGQAVVADVSINWFQGSRTNQLKEFDNDRIYVDTDGNLHFTYLKSSDRSKPTEKYRCGIGSTQVSMIVLSNGNELAVTEVLNPTPRKPILKYDNSGVRVRRFTTATLECLFGGYDPDPSQPHVPMTEWLGKDYRPIVPGGKYQISEDTRRLTITNIQEEDEGDYYCKGKNSVGETDLNTVTLDVTSEPLWEPEGAPADTTVPEGENAIFNCNARSTIDETPPQSPIWYINSEQTGSHTDPSKYLISADKKRLTVLSVRKATDILCVQCKVVNEEGTTWGDGCLNVILGIDITYQPPEKQEIVYGDTIDLTVRATTDPSIKTLNYEWLFDNETYVTTPPYAIMGQDRYTYINTSLLNNDEYKSVAGLYTCEIAHNFQRKAVNVEVVLVDKPVVVPVTASAGFPMWIIALIVGILFLIIIIIIIICVICRKKQEGDYNVDKKETGAGLDPKKELMEKGFDDYSRPDPADFEYGDKPRRELPYDEDAPLVGEDTKSLGEYSEDEEARFFNEDGSFIGQYHKKDPTRPPPPPNESNI
ncbi:neuroglian [Aplysia californica]|uniref:Neuroglian n=1 Tax=Aplysia californica TaxID=6500 RepID=A0ABM0KAM9_APLCA|nr:neuroglian [Aplysia californica]